MGSSGGSSGGSGGTPIGVATAYITTGNTAPLAASVSPVLAGADYVLSLPAAVGDRVLLLASFLSRTSPNFLDIAVRVSGSFVRYASTGTTPDATEGDPGLYPDATFGARNGAIMEFTATADDLDGGNVVFCVVTKGSGGGTLYSSTDYPFRWTALNLGAA